MRESLIICYSRSGQNYVAGNICQLEKGNSLQIAEYLQDVLEADLFEVKTVSPYPVDYMECTEMEKKKI